MRPNEINDILSLCELERLVMKLNFQHIPPKILTKGYGMFPEIFLERPEGRQTNSTVRFAYVAVIKYSD